MSLVVLDTDVCSQLIRGRLRPDVRERLRGHAWAVTFVTIGELTTWADLHDWGERRRLALDAFLANVLELPYSRDVAVTWGRLAARAHRRGRPRPVNDSWIAACCLARQLPLATLNTADFADYVRHDALVTLINGD